GFGFPPLLRRATLVRVEPPIALAGTRAWKLNDAEVPGASVPAFQITDPPTNCPPPVAPLKVSPPVSTSLIVTPAAGPRPWLVAVSVNVTTSPGRGVAGVTVLERIRVGTTLPKVNVCWPTPGLV